jgi:hypothetical protein
VIYLKRGEQLHNTKCKSCEKKTSIGDNFVFRAGGDFKVSMNLCKKCCTDLIIMLGEELRMNMQPAKRRVKYTETTEEALERVRDRFPVGWFTAKDVRIRLNDLLQMARDGLLEASRKSEGNIFRLTPEEE